MLLQHDDFDYVVKLKTEFAHVPFAEAVEKTTLSNYCSVQKEPKRKVQGYEDTLKK